MCFSLKDCPSALHHFEEYQALPTRGAVNVEQFSIDGSQFLVFANSYSDTEYHNTESFIYKLNESTGKFFLYQTIDTSGAGDIEYFTIADKHYLAVANGYNGDTYQLNSVIYQWNEHQFVALQNISTNGSTSFNFFTISQELFLTVTNSFGNSVIYKFKNNQFEKFQEIGTERPWGSTAIAMNNETFIVFANTQNQYSYSTVFKWSGNSFLKLQFLLTHGAGRVESFNINGNVFLVFATIMFGRSYNTNSFIYKWDGGRFVLFQSIPTRGASAWHPLRMCGQTFLGVANYKDDGQGYKTKSVIYRFSGEQFIAYQELSTKGAKGMTSFQYNGHTYLAVANSDDGRNVNINSTLYKWI